MSELTQKLKKLAHYVAKEAEGKEPGKAHTELIFKKLKNLFYNATLHGKTKIRAKLDKLGI